MVGRRSFPFGAWPTFRGELLNFQGVNSQPQECREIMGINWIFIAGTWDFIAILEVGIYRKFNIAPENG